MNESIGDFMARRRREIEQQARDGVAAARETYGEATKSGRRLLLQTADEVAQYSARLTGGKSPKPELRAPTPQPVARQVNSVRPPGGQSVQRPRPGPDRGDVTTAVGADIARRVGNAVGMVRGAANAVEGLVDGATFVSRLVDPLDGLKNPGQSATGQLFQAGREMVEYAGKAIREPTVLVRDVGDKVRQIERDTHPNATPPANTFAGELQRNFAIGQNQGELAFDVGSLVLAGPAAKLTGHIGAASRARVGPERYLAQGFSPSGAAYLATPYTGMGHHTVPRRYRLPEFLGGKPLPPSISDGPFNLLKPEGMTRGDFYRLHFEVDDHFHGTKLPKRVGGESWSGKRLGFERYGLPERLWHGTPAPLKARVGGSATVGGGLIYDLGEEEQ